MQNIQHSPDKGIITNYSCITYALNLVAMKDNIIHAQPKKTDGKE